jgi:hypothetical protein
VPLISTTHDLLKGRKVEFGDGEWVFPSHGSTGHLANPDKAWKRKLIRAGIDDLRGTLLHDLSALWVHGRLIQVRACLL